MQLGRFVHRQIEPQELSHSACEEKNFFLVLRRFFHKFPLEPVNIREEIESVACLILQPEIDVVVDELDLGLQAPFGSYDVPIGLAEDDLSDFELGDARNVDADADGIPDATSYRPVFFSLSAGSPSIRKAAFG